MRSLKLKVPKLLALGHLGMDMIGKDELLERFEAALGARTAV